MIVIAAPSPTHPNIAALPIRRAPQRCGYRTALSAAAALCVEQNELVAVGAEPDAPDLLRGAVGAERLAPQPENRRARRHLQQPADAARRPPRPGSTPAVDAMRMPTARIMSSVEISSALARGSAATSGTSQASRQRHRLAVDQVKPLQRQRLVRAVECRARRRCPPAARAARSASSRALAPSACENSEPSSPCRRLRSCRTGGAVTNVPLPCLRTSICFRTSASTACRSVMRLTP